MGYTYTTGGSMRSDEPLFVWYHPYQVVVFDKPQRTANDIDELLHLSDVILAGLFERGAPIPLEEWEDVVVWIERYHPRVPRRREDIPSVFRSSSGCVHFHSPRVQALLKDYSDLIQYLPVPLLDGCSWHHIAIYYAANFLIQYEHEIWLGEGGNEYRLELDQELVIYPIFLFRSPAHVVVDQHVMKLLLDAQVAEESEFTPLRLSWKVE